MDTPVPVPHSTLEYVLGSLVGLLTVLGSALGWLYSRKQSDAQTDNTKADTAKTVAETRQVEMETAKNAGDIVLGLIREVAAATVRAERIQDERDHWERKAKDAQAELDLAYLNLNKRISVNPELKPFTDSGEHKR